MANEDRRLSEAGWGALRAREPTIMGGYNDQANNCPFGVGTLAHLGPCNAEALRRPVTVARVNMTLAAGVIRAQAQVRSNVTQRELTQAQFDALVSCTYNAGNTSTVTARRAADQSNDADVVSHMNQRVYIHPRDAHGRRLRAVRAGGLANRRRLAAAPFQSQEAR